MIQAAATLSRDVGKKAACEAMEVSRATFYRHLSPTDKAASQSAETTLGVEPVRKADGPGRASQRTFPG